jgi:hypothetical protein
VNSQVSQLTVSIQDRQRRDPRTAPRHDVRGSELIVKEIVMTTSGVVNKRV